MLVGMKKNRFTNENKEIRKAFAMATRMARAAATGLDGACAKREGHPRDFATTAGGGAVSANSMVPNMDPARCGCMRQHVAIGVVALE